MALERRAASSISSTNGLVAQEIVRPSSSAFTYNVGAVPGFFANDSYAWDANYGTSATLYAQGMAAGQYGFDEKGNPYVGPDGSGIATYSFSTKAKTWTSFVLYVDATLNFGPQGYTGCGFWLEYSVDGGYNWTSLYQVLPFPGDGTTNGMDISYNSGNISGNPTISNILVRATALSNGTDFFGTGGDVIGCYIHEIYAVGTYTQATANAYDAPSSGTGVTHYTGTTDTTYALLSSDQSSTAYTAYLSGFGSKQSPSNWNDATLYITYDYLTEGDGGTKQYNSSFTISYCTDWNGSSGTFTQVVNNSGAHAPGTPAVYSVSLSSSVTPSNVCVKLTTTGHAKSGTTESNIIWGSRAVGYVYNAYIESTYDTFTSVSPTNQTINIGQTLGISATYEGAQPSVTSPAGGSWSGTTFTTGAWSYTYNGSSGNSVLFSQTSSGISKTTLVSFNTAYATDISGGYDSLIYGETATYVSGANNASGTYNGITWSATSGSVTTGGLYTAPSSGASDTITAALSNTSGAIKKTKSVSLYPPTVLTTFDSNYSPGQSAFSIPYGQPFRFSSVYSGAGSNATVTWSGGSASLPTSIDVNNRTWYGPTSTSDLYYANWSTSGSARVYTITVPNPTGSRNQKTGTITITPLVVSIGAVTPSNASVTIGNSTTYTPPTVSNAYNTASTWSNSGTGTWNSNTFTPSIGSVAGTQYVITATSTADPTKASATYLYAYLAPIATSLTASTTSVTWDGSFTLTPTFTNGTATWDAGVPVVISGGTSQSILSSTFTGTKRYTLTVTNTPGATATTYVDVTRQTVSVGAISPAGPTVVAGNTQGFSVPTVSGATNTNVTWSDDSGRSASTAFSSTTTGPGTTTTWTAPSTTGVYTITATSVANASISVTTTVTVIGFGSLNGGSAAWIGATGVPLIGSGFSGTNGIASAVTINGQSAPFTVVSNTQINVTIPQMSSYGTVPCVVTVGSTQLTGSGVVYTPSISSITLNPSGAAINETATKQFSATVSGVSGATGTNVSWTATGSAGGVTGFNPQITTGSNYTTWTPPAISTTPQSYTVKASALGNAATNTSTSITVHKLPVASSLVPSASSVTWDGTFTLTPTYQYGSGSLDNGLTCPGSGASTSSLSPSASGLWGATGSGSKTFTLTVTNPLGATATATTSVTRQTVSLGAISPSSITIKVNAAQAIQVSSISGATNTNVSWSDNSGRGASASFSSTTTAVGTNTTWTAPATPGTYRITATSVADPTTTVYVDATVIANTWTFTLNSGSGCNVGGSYSLSTSDGSFTNIDSVTINGQSASYTYDSSTVTVTIPSMASYGTVAISVHIASGPYAGTVASTGLINTPSLSSILASKTQFAEGATGTFSSQTSNLSGNTNINWTGGGSFSPTPTSSGSATTWTAPTVLAASQDYTITATAAGNSATTATKLVTVYKAPVATSLTPSVYFGGGTATSPEVGSQITLLPLFSYGAGSVNTIGAVTSNQSTDPVTVSIGFDQTYTLTVTNPVGSATVSSGRVLAQTVAVSSVTPSASQGLIGSFSPTFTATVTGAVDKTVTWKADKAGTWNGNAFTPSSASPAGTVYTITATSVADSSKSATTTITVYSSSITASMIAVITGTTTPSVTEVDYGSYISLIPTFSSGTAVIGTTGYGSSDISSGATSGTAVPYSQSITTEKTIYLRVTGSLGVTTDVSLTVRPKISISAVVTGTAAPYVTIVDYGESVSLIPSFTSGSATLGTAGAGSTDLAVSAISGQAYLYNTPVKTDVTFYLRVTRSGVNSDTTLTVSARNVVIDPIIPTDSITVTASTTQAFQVPRVTGASDKTVTWSTAESAGSFSPITTAPASSTTWTAPAAPGNYTIIATSVSGTTVTKTVTVKEAQSGSGTPTTSLNPDETEPVPAPIGSLQVGKLIYIGPKGILTQDFDYVKKTCRWIISVGRATAKDKFIFAPHLPMDQKANPSGQASVWSPTDTVDNIATPQQARANFDSDPDPSDPTKRIPRNPSLFDLVNSGSVTVEEAVGAGAVRYGSTHKVEFNTEEDTWIVGLTDYWENAYDANGNKITPYYFGTVQAFDETGYELPRDVVYNDLNTITIKLMFPSTGYVVLS